MIGMKFGWLALEGLCLGCFLYFGSGAALVFAVLLVLIPLWSLFVNLALRGRMEVRLQAGANLRKGEQGDFSVLLENPTVLPVLRVSCKVHIENQLNRETHSLGAVTWLPPKKKQEVRLNLGSGYCGRIRVWVPRVLLYDCFGLIGVRCKCDAVTHVTVQPDLFEPDITLVPNPNSTEDSDTYSQERPGADLTETYQIREYVPGDSPRQIHWKLSNKFDRLIVRDPALPITHNVLVFWERTGETGDPETIDAQAEAIVSLCRALLDQSIQFTIGWNDTDRDLCVLHEIRDMDELVAIIPRLMRATGAREGLSGAGLLLQTGSHALCAHILYLAEQPQSEVMDLHRFGKVTMLLCGKTALDGAVMFDAARYREQLSHIEL